MNLSEKMNNYCLKDERIWVDVKEFIKELKRRVFIGSIATHDDWIQEIINELAGEALISEEEGK